MNKKNNNVNTLHSIYTGFNKDREKMFQFRKKLAEICNIRGEKTIYAKLKENYTPSPIEELAARMIADSISENPIN